MKPEPKQAGALGVPAQDQRAEAVREVLKNFRVVFRSVQKHSHWVETQCGVSGAQLWAMWELLISPGLKVSELSRMLSIHPSTASNLLDKLEKRGLVKRERRGPDQRVVRLFLTTEGLEIINRAPRPAQGVLTDTLCRLPDNTLQDLRHCLAQLVSQINLKDEAAALQPLSDT